MRFPSWLRQRTVPTAPALDGLPILLRSRFRPRPKCWKNRAVGDVPGDRLDDVLGHAAGSRWRPAISTPNPSPNPNNDRLSQAPTGWRWPGLTEAGGLTATSTSPPT